MIYSSLFNLGADGSGGSGGGIAVNTDGGEPVWLGAVIACLVVGVAGIVGMATFYRRKLSKHQESVMQKFLYLSFVFIIFIFQI